MQPIPSCRLLVLFFLITAFVFPSIPAYSAKQPTPSVEKTLENAPPEKVDSILARLSDEQVRNLLIAELSRDKPTQKSGDAQGGGLFKVVNVWLHMFDVQNEQEVESRVRRIVDHVGKVPGDLAGVFSQFGNGHGMGSAWWNVVILIVILAAALMVELLCKTLTANFRREFLCQAVPDLTGYMRLWAGIIREIPLVVHLVIFVGASLFIFMLTPLHDIQSVHYLFMAILFVILFIRIGVILSSLFCSPNLAELRFLPFGDSTAYSLHRIILFFFTYIGIGMSFIVLVSELGIPRESLVLIVICLGSVLLLMTAVILIRNRQPITEYILSAETVDKGSNWVMRQFASLWHIPALLYLFIVWIVFVFQQILGIRQDKGAFLFSLLVVPIFLLLDRIAQLVVQMAVGTLKVYPGSEEKSRDENDGDELTPDKKERLLVVRVGRVVRLTILLALVGWVMTLWGYQIPYMATVTRIVLSSLVTLSLALLFWRVLSAYIENKIRQDEPVKEQDDQHDEEWGAAAQRGRSYTLLPMIRKFIGSVLVVMVTLIILSTMGIEIGPLLAGAGVVGLAIGFGAQKLVHDIFSGFFYLLDDAFRVGEYIQAGSISGSVEAITLRNVMLRHHRGMLQIVPYSELGSITNFMRGGIVVKFNLEFPYNTDIDLVRRIIKKVGQAMLEDEDLGKDFIRPLKSQGVREITSSVMVIRVKFTAKPGAHFIIRREAYRRITEALMAKGIHYAHRKVIVELPESNTADASDRQKIAEAGAAAGIVAMAEDVKKALEGKESK